MLEAIGELVLVFLVIFPVIYGLYKLLKLCSKSHIDPGRGL